MNVFLILLFSLFSPSPASVYDFQFKTIDGKVIKLSKFKGKKIMIVNTASKCGYTVQYADLEKIHEQYGKKLIVIGFPSGDFGNQEFATNDEIKNFCTQEKGVTFLLSQKTKVTGLDADPLFRYLLQQSNPENNTGEIQWNFEKFLINEKGQLAHRFRSKVKPTDPEVVKFLK